MKPQSKNTMVCPIT